MCRFQHRSFLTAILLITALGTSACASRGYVRRQVDPVQTQVNDLEATSEEHAERISAVDSSAQQGINEVRSAAQAAQESADRAAEAAAAASRTAEATQQSLNELSNRLASVENRLNRLYEYAVADTAVVLFGLDTAALTDRAATELDRIASQVRAGDVVELIGHTDSTGSAEYNLALSHRRAQSVQRYLMGRNVDLFKVTIAGLGEENPAADNNTAQGREQNRRVEVRILRPSAASVSND